LALAVHTLLEKNPAHRPATAAEACRLVEQSIARARRVTIPLGVETEPFAGTIGALEAGRYTFTRVVTLFALFAMLVTVAVAWTARDARTGALAQAVRDPAAVTSALTSRGSRKPRRAEPAQLTRDGAWRVAASVSRGRVSDVRLVGTGAGQVVAAIAADPADGMARLLVIERAAGRAGYAVTKSVALDVEGFRGADWTAEVADLDGDGYDEIICEGARPSDGAQEGRRYVVYAPRARETYSLHLAPDPTGAHALRATWSPNTQGREAQLFRHALRQRALVN
jgi:hypothetical protein